MVINNIVISQKQHMVCLFILFQHNQYISYVDFGEDKIAVQCFECKHGTSDSDCVSISLSMPPLEEDPIFNICYYDSDSDSIN